MRDAGEIMMGRDEIGSTMQTNMLRSVSSSFVNDRATPTSPMFLSRIASLATPDGRSYLLHHLKRFPMLRIELLSLLKIKRVRNFFQTGAQDVVVKLQILFQFFEVGQFGRINEYERPASEIIVL